MRILIIPPNYPSKYFPTDWIFVKDQVESLRNAGHTVHILGAIPKTFSMCLRSKNFNFGFLDQNNWLFFIPAFRGCDSINLQIRFWVEKILLSFYVKKNGAPNIVHVHGVKISSIAAWFKSVHRVPFLITEHSSELWDLDKNTSPKLYRNYLLSSYNIAVSESFSLHLSNKFSNKFHYVPNIVNTELFSFSSPRRNKKIINLLSIGTLDDNKNHMALLQSITKILSNGYKISLVIIGSGPLKCRLKKYIDDNNLRSIVTLIDLVPREKIFNYYKEADYFILPSMKETFGVVLIEAMACGIPSLAYRCGGPESILHNSGLGLLLSRNDSLTNGIIKLLSTRFDKKYIRGEALRRYSPTAVVAKLEGIYNSVYESTTP